MRKLFENWDWEDSLNSILLAGLLLFGSWGYRLFTADHHVRSYYYHYVAPSMGTATASSAAYCVEGDIDWGGDITAFCSTDYAVTVEFMTKANATIK